jgi:hypothetical protein
MARGQRFSQRTRRPRRGQPVQRQVLIVSQGEITEPCYIEALKRHWRRGAVDVREHPKDPIALIEWADRETKRKARSGDKYDETWVVFDAERCPDPNVLAQAEAKARAANIQVAMSNPCFEVWLLLHFRYTHAPMVDANAAIAQLQASMPHYAKDRRAAERCIAELIKEVETALTNAGQLRSFHQGSPAQGIPNPTTDVDLLVQAIRPPSN